MHEALEASSNGALVQENAALKVGEMMEVEEAGV
jgi:hypothetical protein